METMDTRGRTRWGTITAITVAVLTLGCVPVAIAASREPIIDREACESAHANEWCGGASLPVVCTGDEGPQPVLVCSMEPGQPTVDGGHDVAVRELGCTAPTPMGDWSQADLPAHTPRAAPAGTSARPGLAGIPTSTWAEGPTTHAWEQFTFGEQGRIVTVTAADGTVIDEWVELWPCLRQATFHAAVERWTWRLTGAGADARGTAIVPGGRPADVHDSTDAAAWRVVPTEGGTVALEVTPIWRGDWDAGGLHAATPSSVAYLVIDAEPVRIR